MKESSDNQSQVQENCVPTLQQIQPALGIILLLTALSIVAIRCRASMLTTLVLSLLATCAICYWFDGEYCIQSKELLQNCFEICETIDWPMKLIIVIFFFFGLTFYVVVPNDWKSPIKRGFLLITAPFLLIYGIGGYEMVMLNRKIEVDLHKKDRGDVLWLFYYSIIIFAAFGFFTQIIIAIYFPTDDEEDSGENSNENEDRKGNSCAFGDVLL
ncbi:hypothetical protein TYRP_012164 [Tyrophagus putrescentiae]|nr:hypothetical protein TYRP_012164 [Tyrophagus putrescentiae]